MTAPADEVVQEDAELAPAPAVSNGHAEPENPTEPPALVADGPAPAAPEAPSPAEAPAATTEAPAPAEAEAPAEPAAATAGPPVTITPDAEKPAFGPRILGIAEPVKPLPSKTAPVKKQRRRRRPSAAERHRRAFFSALTELRRSGKITAEVPAAADGSAEEPQATPAPQAPEVEAAPIPTEEAPVAAEAPAAAPEAAAEAPEAVAETPAPAPEVVAETPEVAPEPVAEPEAEATPEPAATAEAAPEAEASQSDRSASSPARVAAAMERVGGAEVIKEALKPKQDEKGQPLKWAAVCAQAAEGLKPGDPVFNAWVRLAATPVREVKAQLPRPEQAARPAGREPGRRNGGQRASEGGRRDRPRRDDRANRQAFASHAQDGTLRKSIRIITGHDEDQERRERERVRKEQREAKRRAERERLARLGY